jgi:hypothetical protein
MKQIKDMNLEEVRQKIYEHALVINNEKLYSLLDQLDYLTAEWERRWKNLSVSQRIDAIAYPPDPNSLFNLFLRFMDNSEREIAELEKQLAWHKMSESERLESIAIDGTESVKRRAKERKEKRKQILDKIKSLKDKS